MGVVGVDKGENDAEGDEKMRVRLHVAKSPYAVAPSFRFCGGGGGVPL